MYVVVIPADHAPRCQLTRNVDFNSGYPRPEPGSPSSVPSRDVGIDCVIRTEVEFRIFEQEVAGPIERELANGKFSCRKTDSQIETASLDAGYVSYQPVDQRIISPFVARGHRVAKEGIQRSDTSIQNIGGNVATARHPLR